MSDEVLAERPRRYTMHDTPAVVARIEGDLATALGEIRAADPGLRALVLSGGFSRGEGATVAGVPQNDYDFVAIRGLPRPREPYPRLRARLERLLGLHIDLARVALWRLPHVARRIFWYETALRGRTLWGPDYLDRIPVRAPHDIERTEGLRLLCNRAAGLLLSTGDPDPNARRLQASKALLGVLDAHLLARGEFRASQVERWRLYEALRTLGTDPPPIRGLEPWLAWAIRFKVEPEALPERDPHEAWSKAAEAVLEAVPVALRHAGLGSLDAYAERDGLVDRLVYLARSRLVPGHRWFVRHPTGHVRVATLRLLEASRDGDVPAAVARELFRPMARVNHQPPLRVLAALRAATLQ